jgi:L-lactate dehydrogenase
MSKRKSKVAIIGAGFVGSSTAYNIAINKAVGEIVLLDVNRDKAKGEALDINHGLCHLGQMNIHDGEYSDCADADVIVITAGLGRKPGETRLDLAAKNIPIAKDITDNVMKYYNGGIILVVSNPADILTYFIQKWSGLPASMVFGTGTALDSARFRYYIAKKLGVDVLNVHGYVIGEHGDTQVPLWSATQIAGQSVDEYCSATGIVCAADDKAEIASNTKNGGGEVIKLKGATNYAIAGIVENVVEAIIKDEHSIKTVASVLGGQYGIEDVALSLPAMITSDGIERIIHYNLDKPEEEALERSVNAMKTFLSQVKEKAGL